MGTFTVQLFRRHTQQKSGFLPAHKRGMLNSCCVINAFWIKTRIGPFLAETNEFQYCQLFFTRY